MVVGHFPAQKIEIAINNQSRFTLAKIAFVWKQSRKVNVQNGIRSVGELWVPILIKKKQTITKSTKFLRQFIDKGVFRQNKRPCKVWAPEPGSVKKVTIIVFCYLTIILWTVKLFDWLIWVSKSPLNCSISYFSSIFSGVFSHP